MAPTVVAPESGALQPVDTDLCRAAVQQAPGKIKAAAKSGRSPYWLEPVLNRCAELALKIEWGLIRPENLDPEWIARVFYYRLGSSEREYKPKS